MDSDEASHLNASLASLTLGKRTRHDSAPNCYIDGATSASTSFNKKKARDSNDCHMFEEYREPSVRENGGAKLGRTSSQMDFDEYMQVNHGSCSDDKKNWALTIYNDNQDTIRNRLERVGSINDKNDKGQGLRLLASLWKNEPQKLPVEDKVKQSMYNIKTQFYASSQHTHDCEINSRNVRFSTKVKRLFCIIIINLQPFLLWHMFFHYE